MTRSGEVKQIPGPGPGPQIASGDPPAIGGWPPIRELMYHWAEVSEPAPIDPCTA